MGQTPLAWNSGVFSMIRNLSETVIVPIAGVILTFVMCYELIQLVTEKNNLHDVDTWMFFKWIFKTFCAVLIVTNTWNIVMGIFDVGQSVVNSSAGVIIGNTSIDISSVITDMERSLKPGHGRIVRAVVPVPFRGAYHERPFHLYHACHLRPHD